MEFLLGVMKGQGVQVVIGVPEASILGPLKLHHLTGWPHTTNISNQSHVHTLTNQEDRISLKCKRPGWNSDVDPNSPFKQV